jgi:lipoate-protein ligase A
MELYNLGKAPWQQSQLIYHALAYLGRESLVLVSPASPYVCVGYHQDIDHEVDLAFCRANNIPVFRREVGGGGVYLDGNQLFFQLILKRDNPLVPARKEAFYRKFLQPVINVYRKIGILAEYRAVNDIIVETRKISGTGVGEIGECIVLVGNLIVDFNYKMMARVLKVPDEKFRDKVQKTIEENLSTIRRELGDTSADKWNDETLNNLMVDEFEKVLGRFNSCEKDAELEARADELALRMLDDDWFYRKGRHRKGRAVKISSDVTVYHKIHKAPGGLMRADFEVDCGRFAGVSISGDFFCYPEDAISRLESMLEGKQASKVYEVFTHFYGNQEIETPGICIDDWKEILEV